MKNKTAKHTTGPWFVTPAGGIAGNGEAIIINGIVEHEKTLAVNNGFGRAKANTKLIASAPELLGALINTKKVLQKVLDEFEAAKMKYRSGFISEHILEIEKAIAKAEGNEVTNETH